LRSGGPRGYLLQNVSVTDTVGRLVRRGRRSGPSSSTKIKELSHVHLCRISRRKGLQSEAGFDELEDCRVVRGRVGKKVLFGERGHDQGGKSEAPRGEITIDSRPVGADVARLQIFRLNPIGTNRDWPLQGGNVIVGSTRLIVSQNKHRILP